ncbi:hypothetical protein N8637_00640 [Verrucomicrobia bacterium]|nr:hypothetical protein [Verrucomicrobiota bacterium]MDB4777520.1 hypothetical protein [Verrucomicrobiota bacterium]
MMASKQLDSKKPCVYSDDVRQHIQPPLHTQVVENGQHRWCLFLPRAWLDVRV